ncbi:protein-disulfide reductase DsbD (plasmid) [Neorhizobium sp. DAR64861/K0K2]|uniref:protein-disulfide reductase DsbD n=1 Tax=Neorhizobium sp. DAR64861/K0K2 TaxID=3421956 RepID=UPI003D2B16F1
MRIASFVLAGIALLITALTAVAADAPLPMDEAFKPSVERTADGRALVRWQLADGYYLYREYLGAKDDADKPLDLQTMPGTLKNDPNFGSTEIYYKSASATISDPPNSFKVTYQGCQDHGLCYPPTTKSIDMATLRIGDSQAFATLKTKSASEVSSAFSKIADEPDFTISDDHAQTMIDRMLADGGLTLLVAGFAGFGLLLAFTPCVFPIYPIVAAMLAREGETLTARRGFVLSSSYVLALAGAFGLLGMAAAWSGQNLQIALQSTYAVGAIATLFVILALSNFGLFHLQLPASITARIAPARKRGGSVPGAMILGFSSALFIGPCVTAPLAGALLYIARTGDVAVGALALFALGIGKGIPLVVMATAGSNILPKAGAWMENVRHIFGFLFLATALWLASPLFAESLVLLGWAVLALAFGVFVFTAATATQRPGPVVLSRTAGLASILWGALLFVGIGLGATDPLNPLAPLRSATGSASVASIEKSMFAKASSTSELIKLIGEAPEQEPTLLYVTADWCVSCRSIERSVLPSPEVARALQGVRLVTLDISQLDAAKQAMMSQLKVIGPPTMLFLDSERKEAASTRLVGEFSADDLAEAALKARDPN